MADYKTFRNKFYLFPNSLNVRVIFCRNLSMFGLTLTAHPLSVFKTLAKLQDLENHLKRDLTQDRSRDRGCLFYIT